MRVNAAPRTEQQVAQFLPLVAAQLQQLGAQGIAFPGQRRSARVLSGQIRKVGLDQGRVSLRVET
ncbi:hypothetical protein D3C86_2264930 [compost metagenome]